MRKHSLTDSIFSTEFQPRIKGWYPHCYLFPFIIFYAWQNFWVQIKSKAW